MSKQKIFLVEDDESIGQTLQDYLNTEGYETHWTKSITAAKAQIKGFAPDLVTLDWMLPDGQGIDFLRELRSTGQMMPVIMLTARSDLIDKILGLETGANDYLTKPFEPRELIARIRSHLRANQNMSASPSEKPLVEDVLKNSGLEIHLTNREVHYEGQNFPMTKMEFDLLKLLVESPGKVFSRDEILNRVWGYDNYPSTRTVDTHILQLRNKFGDELFQTVRGIGYRFVEKK